jgi:hypothetical protein
MKKNQKPQRKYIVTISEIKDDRFEHENEYSMEIPGGIYKNYKSFYLNSGLNPLNSNRNRTIDIRDNYLNHDEKHVKNKINITSGMVMLWIVILSWLLLLIAAAVEKICTTGAKDYFRHFTNWSWTGQIFFYYFLLVGLTGNKHLNKFLIQWILIPIWGMVWIVFVLVLIMILNNGRFILRYIGHYEPGVVFFGNALFHYIPLVVLIMIVATIRLETRTHLRKLVPKRWGWKLVLITLWEVYSPLALLGIYSSFNNVSEIYETDIPVWAGTILALIIVTLFSGLFWYYFGLSKNIKGEDGMTFITDMPKKTVVKYFIKTMSQ